MNFRPYCQDATADKEGEFDEEEKEEYLDGSSTHSDDPWAVFFI